MTADLTELKVVANDGVLVRVKQEEEKTAGGIIRPDFSRRPNDDHRDRKAWRAFVEKFGEKVDLEAWGPYAPEVGDQVVIAAVAYDCPKSERDGEMYVLVKAEDIIAVERSMKPENIDGDGREAVDV